jgi:Flp pilus assembly pilin Flp
MSKILRAHLDAPKALRRFVAHDGGATAVEYGLMVSLISVAIAATIATLGADIKTVLYDQIGNALSGH